MDGLIAIIVIISIVLGFAKNVNKTKQNQQRYNRRPQDTPLPTQDQRPAQAPQSQQQAQRSAATPVGGDIRSSAQDLLDSMVREIQKAIPTESQAAQNGKRVLSDADRRKIEAYRAQRLAKAGDQNAAQLQQASAARFAGAEGIEFHGDGSHSSSLADYDSAQIPQTPYMGSMGPGFGTVEGECAPGHRHSSFADEHADAAYLPERRQAADAYAAASVQAIDHAAMQNAVVWSEILKRPRVGVAPRYR